MADLVWRIGDTVYVDGKRYTWEEWKNVRDQRTATAAAAPATAPAPASAPAPAGAPAARAASCVSSIFYAEFPSDDERFECSAGLGALTRDELTRAGWRVDYVEKIPAPAAEGRPPLFKYKLVVSR